MNDEQMQSLLDTWFEDTDPTPPDTKRTAVGVMARVPLVRQRGRWWPLPVFHRPLSTFPSRELAPVPIPTTNGPTPTRGFTMLSAVKLIAASAIVALFGGFLVTGILTTPQEDQVLPAALTECPSPLPATGSDFPTGTFIALDHPGLVVEFRQDGTATGKWYAERWENLVRYAINGEFFTEMTHESEARQVPATYYWDFDGDLLRFEVWGEDVVSSRAATYANTFRLVQDPVEVVVAARDIPAGETVYSTWAITGIAPAAQVGPDTFTDFMDVIGDVAAVDIAMGQPITPDMLEPAAE